VVRLGQVLLGPFLPLRCASLAASGRVSVLRVCWDNLRSGPRAFSDPEKQVKRIINPANVVASALCIE
jgi:hypothetical protein